MKNACSIHEHPRDRHLQRHILYTEYSIMHAPSPLTQTKFPAQAPAHRVTSGQNAGTIRPAMQIEPSYIGVLANVMRKRGHDLAPLGPRRTTTLNETEIDVLLGRVAAATRHDPALPLHVGAAMHMGTHGLFGHALMSCRTLKQAAGILMRHNPLRGDHARSDLTYENGDAILTFEPPLKVKGAPNFLTDLFFAAATTAIRELTGAESVAGTLELSYEPQADRATYEEVMRTPVVFGQEANRLRGSVPMLEVSLRSAGVVTADAYLRQCEALLRRMQTAGSHESSVRRVLLSSRGAFPSAPEIAKALSMSERTLRRRLEGEKTSYQTIVDDVRNHLARQYLSDTTLNVAEVGALVGFEDTANFRHAFRRWNGVTPAQFRVLENVKAERSATAKETRAATNAGACDETSRAGEADIGSRRR